VAFAGNSRAKERLIFCAANAKVPGSACHHRGLALALSGSPGLMLGTSTAPDDLSHEAQQVIANAITLIVASVLSIQVHWGSRLNDHRGIGDK
jgi:hypothetical protein